MKTLIISALLLASPALAGNLKSDLTTRMEQWAKSFNQHDPKALVTDYTDDAQFIYAFEGQEGKGRAALEQFYAQSFKMTPDVHVTLKSYDVVQVSQDVAVGLGVWEDSLTGPDGKKLTLPVHTSEVWVRRGGKWMLRVDHASFVPPPQPPPPGKQG
jgi:uncharacterized protein (TIGR02246 family)